MLYLAGQILVFVLVAMLIGAALAWVFLIGPMRRQVRAAQAQAASPTPTTPTTRAAQATPAAEPAAESIAEPATTDSPSGTATTEAATTEAATESEARAAADTRVADQLAELTALLRQQRDEIALEKAELAARLAEAERSAAESEQRVAAAESQLAQATSRVADIEAELRDRSVLAAPATAGEPVAGAPPSDDASVPAGPAGTAQERDGSTAAASVDELTRMTDVLRRQLHEAESRAAKFSSRLAMVRTEAEDAQRQVATMTTRMDRHQAEWAAERVSLLGRIAQTEAALGRPAGSGGDPAAGEARGTGVSADVDLSGARPAAVASTGRLAALASTGSVATGGSPTGLSGAGVSGAGIKGAGIKGAGVRSAVTGTVAAGESSAGRITMEPTPRWNGFLEPRPSGDNLKEIVGIGPVIESRLRALGITMFSQLAEMGDTDVDRLARRLDGFGDRIVSDDWVGQAQDLQARHYGGVY